MANKNIKSVIVLKRGTAEQWSRASAAGYIPKTGEPVFYQKDPNDLTSTEFNILKIGDGFNTPDNLPALTIDDGDISE